jgi:hypothetical protein
MKRMPLSFLVGFVVLVALWPLGCVGGSASAAEAAGVVHDDGTTSCISAFALPLPWAETGDDSAFLVAIVGGVLAFAAVRWLPWPRRDRSAGR